MNLDTIPVFKPSPDNYLVRNHIIDYLNDSVSQLLEYKNSNPKVDVIEFFTEYFQSVKQGSHILLRDYSFISSTPYNRACFIEKFLDTYSAMIEKQELMSIHDYIALIHLLCSDFSIEIIEKSIKIISGKENLNVFLKDFIYGFQFQFYYKEFIEECKMIYKNLKVNDLSSSKLNSKKFLSYLETLSLQVYYSFPPKSVLEDVLNQKELEFDEFLHELCMCDKITFAVGKLPIRSNLSEYLHQKKPLLKKPQTPTENLEEIKKDTVEISKNSTIKKSVKKKSQPGNDQANKSSSNESSSDTDT